MWLSVLFLIIGLGLLFVGAETLVRASVALAERLGMSKLIIGLTVVGFGTSTPELLVSISAALRGSPELALGNIVGSNTANILLIIGIAALVQPLSAWPRSAIRDCLIAALVALALYGIVHGATIGRIEGAAMFMALIAYLAVSYWLERRESRRPVAELETEEFEDIAIRSKWLSPVLIVVGIAILLVGAELLVRGAVTIAREFGVSDAVIGLSLVAIGTSLPELATGIVAAYRKHSDVVIGNVIGSNIFNVLCILALTALVQPISVSPRFAELDTVVMLAVSIALLLLMVTRPRIGRIAGAVMLAAYGAYMWVLFGVGAIG
jgi:cation:H+ antiporter